MIEIHTNPTKFLVTRSVMSDRNDRAMMMSDPMSHPASSVFRCVNGSASEYQEVEQIMYANLPFAPQPPCNATH